MHPRVLLSSAKELLGFATQAPEAYGALADAVKSKVIPCHRTVKLENAPTPDESYTKDPEVGVELPLVKLMLYTIGDA
jgi:hypothetical protein